MGTSHISLADAAVRTVGEVMIRRPKTLPATATVADACRLFENQGVRTALLVDGDRYAGELTRDHLTGAADDEPVAARADADATTVAASEAVAVALARMDAAGTDRLAVVDADGTLRGLVCLSRSAGELCTDPR